MLDKPIIAIVEDDRSVRESIVNLVTAMGFDAESFERASDFLRSDRLAAMSCLIADVRMPGMTGLEMLDRLLASGCPIPSIVITAFPRDRDRRRAVRAGAICYLAKPFTDNELLKCIRCALSAGHGSRGGS